MGYFVTIRLINKIEAISNIIKIMYTSEESI